MPKSKEFISSSESDSEDDKPKAKKKKTEKPKPAEKPKPSSSKGKDGEEMFQLSKMRYVTVSEFRGKCFVNIREYYESDGEMKPGKKGIALNAEQWTRLKEQMEEIDAKLKSMQ
ncbi:activated RNA polymerase II transcriptional coactivator p15 [Lingula anatina]|uniref:Activated RNA polymerase II transcriptional coactivator p15 n=1 Tax=Lingula anatina TaxID=7574 RepID=A0A1S3GZE1_LINAN|nr:activated RNA polymerase II transcriptional coactivator p15 [Lingula anatina]XP_013378597.1 activated RNA polymerase II transcriptional coactivator p15 [Lingula anatina]|eukprot:XP_013378596.1 activated RNA polymerase II transcriptional coactivator p15 [Lingula anatina]